ncbi:MAG: (2Fe-2S)-binding protein [Tepidamorphaceae bacterium]|nr:(2Fe-2S)-binding protein [Nitratireductor sp.]MCC0048065.1 (2Fe-2S)-binding protein [Rhodobiaceae bacterium]
MIVCSCNVISRSEIEETITGFLRRDPWAIVTPGMVYHAMQKRGKCCGCFPNVVGLIVEVTEAYHREIETPSDRVVQLVSRLRSEHERHEMLRRLAKARRGGVAA